MANCRSATKAANVFGTEALKLQSGCAGVYALSAHADPASDAGGEHREVQYSEKHEKDKC